MLRWATSSAASHMHTRDPGSGGGQGQQAVASASSQQGSPTVPDMETLTFPPELYLINVTFSAYFYWLKEMDWLFFTSPTLPGACSAPGIQPLHFPCTLVQGWGSPTCSVGSSYCRTCPAWGTEWILDQAVLYRSQNNIISFGWWHGCGCDRCPAMPGRDWLGYGWCCQCPGEAGASLIDPMPVS